jgi:hypothetical protein
MDGFCAAVRREDGFGGASRPDIDRIDPDDGSSIGTSTPRLA